MTQTAPDLRASLAAHEQMLLIRRFEEQCLQLRRRDLVAGSIHLSAGQEAIPVGARAALRDGDRVVATYRGHGWAIAWGVPLEGLLAEVCQRATGVNGGRAGSAYLSAPEHGFVGENSIVAAGLPIANGLAAADVLQGTGAVTVASFGDGATNQGAAHEALVMAIARRLPVIFVCENNGWSEMTPIDATVPVGLAARAAGYGLPAVEVDGTDPAAVSAAVAEAAERARAGDGPTFLECRAPRLWGHYNADVEQYRPSADRQAAEERDPLSASRARLRDGGADAAELDELETGVAATLGRVVEAVLAAPQPDPATAAEHVVAPTPLREGPLAVELGTEGGTSLTMARATGEALSRELRERPEVIVFGEDVAIPGGVFGVTRGLAEQAGHERVFDTPISEAAILGLAVGASMAGQRPVAEVMWADFLLVALDQLVNQAANVRYLSRGAVAAPLVVRCQQGAAPGSCAQHSQSLEALLLHVPGLLVGMPGTPQDAYAMTRAAVAAEDPCVLIESRAAYGRKGDVAVEAPVEAVGGARLRRAGPDAAIITWGPIQEKAMRAAQALAEESIEVAVLDLRWLCPLDDAAIAEVVAACGRVVVLHEAVQTQGFGAEIVARIVAHHFDDLDAPPTRVATPAVRMPASPVLQEELLPGVADVVAAVRGLVRG